MRNSINRTALAVAVLTLGAVAAGAQQRSGKGYLFHEPEVRITLRGGYDLATANSDIFSFTTENLTLNKRDFSGFTAGLELAIPVTSRLEISGDASYIRSVHGSEFRHFIDNNDQPIEQTTYFERVPLLLNARYFLTSPGRSIGKLAWIPAKMAPWIGAGAGTMYYEFRQDGDWVDFKNSNVFPAKLETSAWTPAAQAMAGAEFTLTPLIGLATEARYLWAKGPVSRDFSGFDKIDLSGVSATVGLTFRL